MGAHAVGEERDDGRLHKAGLHLHCAAVLDVRERVGVRLRDHFRFVC